jgi:hypothetical protein
VTDKTHTKHETSEGKYNGHIGKGNKWERESQQGKDGWDVAINALNAMGWDVALNARKGRMGCRTKRANWR